MDTSLNGKVAVITGGTSGIGLAIAKAFVAEGAMVVLTGIDQAAIDEAVAAIGENCSGFKADVSILAEMDALYSDVKSRHARLDIVVANAGVGDHAPLGSITEAQIDRMFNTNAKGVVFTVQPALHLLRSGASIVIIGSIGSIHGPPAMGIYSGTKAAIRGFVRSWIQDVKGTGIRINVLSPGAIDTESLRNALTAAVGADKLDASIKTMGADNPLGRVGQVEEVAKAAVFLASDASSYITGVELYVDGGLAQV